MERKLIVDCITFDIPKDVINEAMSKGGPFIVKGILQRAGEAIGTQPSSEGL